MQDNIQKNEYWFGLIVILKNNDAFSKNSKENYKKEWNKNYEIYYYIIM